MQETTQGQFTEMPAIWSDIGKEIKVWSHTSLFYTWLCSVLLTNPFSQLPVSGCVCMFCHIFVLVFFPYTDYKEVIITATSGEKWGSFLELEEFSRAFMSDFLNLKVSIEVVLCEDANSMYFTGQRSQTNVGCGEEYKKSC